MNNYLENYIFNKNIIIKVDAKPTEINDQRINHSDFLLKRFDQFLKKNFMAAPTAYGNSGARVWIWATTTAYTAAAGTPDPFFNPLC